MPIGHSAIRLLTSFEPTPPAPLPEPTAAELAFIPAPDPTRRPEAGDVFLRVDEGLLAFVVVDRVNGDRCEVSTWNGRRLEEAPVSWHALTLARQWRLAAWHELPPRLASLTGRVRTGDQSA
jgi:hypothetical protein